MVGFSPDGDTLAIRLFDDRLAVLDSADGELVHAFEMSEWEPHLSQYTLGLAWLSADSVLVLGRMINTVVGWDARTGEQVFTMVWGQDGWEQWMGLTPIRMAGTAWMAERKELAYGLHDNRVIVWNTDRDEPRHLIEGHTSPAYSLAYSPDGTRLASVSANETKVWDIATGQALLTIKVSSGNGSGLGWSSDGTMLATAHGDGSIAVRDAGTGKRLQTLEGSGNAPHTIGFNADGTALVSVSRNGPLILWDLETGHRLRTLERSELKAPYEQR